MQVHYRRLRSFAANSSSTHSLIFTDDLPARNEEDPGMGHFGWDDFTLVTPEAKTRYLAAQVVSNGDMALAFELLREHDLPLPTERWDYQVDHQSRWDLPRGRHGRGDIDRTYVAALDTWMRSEPHLLVLGGNDNSDGHPRESTGTEVRVAGSVDGDRDTVWWARKDGGQGSTGQTVPEHWTLFSPVSGSKLRLTLTDPRKATPAPTKAWRPELVDLAITDYCPYNCEFCYRGSTTEGAHAAWEDLEQIASGLSELDCFEVALGGGEPTLHPDFGRLVRLIRTRGMIPNVTTRNLRVFTDIRYADAMRATGAVAFSVATANEAADVVSAFAAARQLNPDTWGEDWIARKVQLQVVLGSCDLRELCEILQVAREGRVQVTLLGYKRDQRGATFVPDALALDGWVPMLEALRGQHGLPRLAVDSAAVTAERTRLLGLGIDPTCLEAREGAFSMFIDGVTGRMSASSYGQGLKKPGTLTSAAERQEKMKARLRGGPRVPSSGEQITSYFATC